jgi:hypothetical protein
LGNHPRLSNILQDHFNRPHFFEVTQDNQQVGFSGNLGAIEIDEFQEILKDLLKLPRLGSCREDD